MGETRRFIDEIEYLLDGLIGTGTKSGQIIRSSIEEIVEKCFVKHEGEYSVNVGFCMKLKSHGALGIIFESLNDSDDPVVLNNLILLISALLYDVRRLDFFFKPELAIKIAKHCINVDIEAAVTNPVIEMLKCTQVFNMKTCENAFIYVSIWILSKWAFSSVTRRKEKEESKTDTDSGEFFDLLLKDEEMIEKVIKSCELFDETGEKAACLLDFLLNKKLIKMNESLIKLLDKIIKLKADNVTFMKLAVSLTGSSTTRIESRNLVFELIEKLIKISFPFKGEDIEILSLSCLINLIDRSEDYLMDEFRYFKISYEQSGYNDTHELSLLQLLAYEYKKCPCNLKLHKSLLVMILGFICRQNRTNIEVISRTINNENVFNELKGEVIIIATNFLLQQQQQEDEDVIVIERLNEIISTFKK